MGGATLPISLMVSGCCTRIDNDKGLPGIALWGGAAERLFPLRVLYCALKTIRTGVAHLGYGASYLGGPTREC